MLHAEPFETHLLSAELCILFIYFLKRKFIGLEYHIILSKIHIIVIIKTKIIDQNKSCSNNVVHINFNFFMHHVMKESSHCPLVSCACILQSKRHHFVAKGTPWGDERCLLHVFRSHLNLIITGEPVHEGKDIELSGVINQHVDMW